MRKIFPEYLYARIRLVSGIVNFFFSSFFSVDLSLVSFNWFLTVFVDNFPVEVCIQSLTEVYIFVLEVLVPKTGFLTVRNFVFCRLRFEFGTRSFSKETRLVAVKPDPNVSRSSWLV